MLNSAKKCSKHQLEAPVMKSSSVLIRTGSIGPVHSPTVSGSPRVCLSRNNSLSGVFSGERSSVASPRICLHFDLNRFRDENTIRRSLSDSNILRSDSGRSRSFPSSEAGRSPGSGVPVEERGCPGGDCGIESSHVTIEREERRKMGAYYQEMLKSNPGDPLLLRNYGQFLHEVTKLINYLIDLWLILINTKEGDLRSELNYWRWRRIRCELKSTIAEPYWRVPETASCCRCTGSWYGRVRGIRIEPNLTLTRPFRPPRTIGTYAIKFWGMNSFLVYVYTHMPWHNNFYTPDPIKALKLNLFWS